MRVLFLNAIFAVFLAIRKNKFPENKNFRKHFSHKNFLQSKYSLHKNTVLRNRVCSITTCLFHSETTKYWLIAWKYVFLLDVLNKNENNTMLGTGYFLKIAKICSSQEKPICSNRKNCFLQHTKNRQSAKNFVPPYIAALKSRLTKIL